MTALQHEHGTCKQMRAGFTLIEMVMSLAIAGVLALAVNAAIFIATRSLPGRGDALTASSDLLVLEDIVRTDVELASSVRVASATSIEFDVPDRTGDDVPERVELSWDGQAGGFTDGGWSPIFAGNQIAIQVAPSIPATDQWRLTGVEIYLREGTRPAVKSRFEISAGRDVISVGDAWRHSVQATNPDDIANNDGEWVIVPLRTPWMDHDEAINVRLHNAEGDARVDFRLKPSFSMPSGLYMYKDVLNTWSPIAAASSPRPRMAIQITPAIATAPASESRSVVSPSDSVPNIHAPSGRALGGSNARTALASEPRPIDNAKARDVSIAMMKA